MKKSQTINLNEFLQESMKAQKLLSEYVEEKRRGLAPDEKIMFLKKIIKQAKTYEEKQVLEKELEEQRFLLENGEQFPMMPTEHREKILSNLKIEVEEVDAVLKEQYDLLHKSVDGLGQIITLISNIKRLEEMRKLVPQIIKYRDGILERKMPSYVLQEHSFIPHHLIVTKEELKGEDISTVLSEMNNIRRKISNLKFSNSQNLFYGGDK
ncbi:hypothetical protein [Lysinibacillus sp. G01H]|uniref:hypothetical protein n=1 Tax=Lysinibacillus sp. G01H TaxID=3026425 RepID=UPI00237D56FC|nr:hypothetical protein [Lysinibacillus sp. G01H]WDU80293.1 hypothetical protein PSR12_03830 [Lysinibacillus sp. G01H]